MPRKSGKQCILQMCAEQNCGFHFPYKPPKNEYMEAAQRHPVLGIEDGRFLMWIFMYHELLYSCHTCNRNDSSQETHVLGIAESC